MPQQRGGNIEYLIITQINRHEENFEIRVDDAELIELLYDIIKPNELTEVPYPIHGMGSPHIWEIHIHYRDGRYYEIFVVNCGLFYRWLPTRSEFGDTGFAHGDNRRLPNLIQNIFREQGFHERPRFHETEISDERWSEVGSTHNSRIHTSNSDFSFLIGQEFHTLEDAKRVANIIIEAEKNDESLLERRGEVEIYRRDFFDKYELQLIEHDRYTGIWVFSFWVDEMLAASYSLRVAFDGNTGEIIKMWIQWM